jgi:hypothetical protein
VWKVRIVTIRPNQVLELIWIAWVISWIAASFWSARTQKRAATLETWTYRAAMIAGGILLVPWTAPLLREKPIWEINYGGALALTAVMLAGLLLTWWARIYLGPLWSSVITCKKDHRIVDTGPYAFVRHDLHWPHHCAARDSGRRGKSDGANRCRICHLRRLAQGPHGGALLDG